MGQVYIVAEPAQREDEIVAQIIGDFDATWVASKPAQDHYLCRIAPVFIGSFGTFSVQHPSKVYTVAYFDCSLDLCICSSPLLKANFHKTWSLAQWTIAYLSQGREIHLPIVSNMSFGSTWNWWDALFIEDDPRITYHDEVLLYPCVFTL